MPKLYFAKKDLQVPQGATVHVRYSFGATFSHTSSMDNKLKDAIDEGRSALNCAVNYLANTDTANLNANFKRYASKYFFLGNTPEKEELLTMYSVLQLTKAGVDNELTVKVFNKWGSTGGYVTNYGGTNSAQAHRTSGMYNNPEKNQNYIVQKGDIHMGFVAMQEKTALQRASLFIHEATHKFANTADFGEKGYTREPGGFYREEGLTKEQALMNADSYARFAIHFYRGENGMMQW